MLSVVLRCRKIYWNCNFVDRKPSFAFYCSASVRENFADYLIAILILREQFKYDLFEFRTNRGGQEEIANVSSRSSKVDRRVNFVLGD